MKCLNPGDPVVLCEARGTVLGRGYVNPRSLIAVRLLTHGNELWDDGFILRRIEDAVAYRQIQNPKSQIQNSDACRLIYSESDGLPGLIVDRFNDQLIVQSLTAGMERLLPQVIDTLITLMQPAGIYMKGKSPFRELEGLPQEDRQLFGSTPDKIPFQERELTFTARPKDGQKTGYFLDQRGNRAILAPLIRKGDRVLDLYSYTGGWGLTAIKASAAEAVMIDSSAKAIKWGMEDAERNDCSDRAIFVEADVEEFLKDDAKRVGRASSPTSQPGRLTYATGWDVVVVDPPALIPNRQSVNRGINAYIAINRAALKIVRPGGLLVTCSCSHLLTREKHLEVIGRAAFQEGRRVRIEAVGGHSYDHPILPGHPETEYLKCWLIRVGKS